jgi:menaquinol-cytochrome c reductase cytochrome b/c subunit
VTEIPEHLLKRAAEAKAKAAAKAGGDAPVEEAAPATEADAGATADVTPQAAADPSGKIPAHLLARSAAAKAKAAGGGGGGGGDDAGAAGGGGGGGVAAPARPDAGTPAATGAAGPRVTGLSSPEGHTQRLLTVVKAGSIQDVKMTPTDKVHVWPHLLAAEFLASLAMTAFMLVFSVFVNAPLLGLRNYNQTPNPSKAPWYFLGLQELLTMFHPMVAGVTIPGMGIFLLILAPYIDRNPSNKPEDRKFAITMMVIFLMFWAVLVIIGSFFRGPGFNFILPWRQGVHEIFDL